MSISIPPTCELPLVKIPVDEDEERQPSYGSILVVARRGCQYDDEESMSSRASASSRMEKERPSDDNPRYTVYFVMMLVAIAYAVLIYGVERGEGAISFGSGGSENRQAASVIVSVMHQVHQQP
jgi:hypothetical protein